MDKSKIIISDKIPIKEFCKLRESVNFQKLTEKQAERVLAHTSFIITAIYNECYIGLTRILFDYVTDAYITDVIVHPDYQGCGVGGILIQKAIEYLKTNTTPGLKVSCCLYANAGKEAFYQKYGFQKLPNDKYGYGMFIEL